MGLHPFLGSIFGQIGDQASDSTTITTATFTTSATAYNNATPVELVASTSRDSAWLTIRIGSNIAATGARSSTVFEVMAGSSGNEYPIIGPVVCGNLNTQSTFTFPIYIPAGTRLSIRFRSARVSLGILVSWALGYLANGADGTGLPQRWVAYGVNDDGSANAQGTIVAPGASAATWGSWTAVTTSTTYAHDLWIPMVDAGTQTTITAQTVRTRWALASTTGAATMATNGTVWHGPWLSYGTSEGFSDGWNANGNPTYGRQAGFGMTGPFYCPAPAGSAVSVSAKPSTSPLTNALGCSILAAI